MGLNKKAGVFEVEVRDAGWPIWSDVIWDNGVHGERFHGLRLEDLKDLHYCLGAAIAHVQAGEDADRARSMARLIGA